MNKDLNVFHADLHIHTPASKCYKGNKNEKEFLKIISKAKEQNLDIIAISDHNSIEGYNRLINLKNDILTELNTLKSLNDSQQAKHKVKKLEEKHKLFKNILIIPAIEFEVNNGVHILVLFNPSYSIPKIRNFLNLGGYDSESYGFENTDTISRWSIFDLYNETEKYDCIVVDGHTDSHKGIFNTFPKGNTRAHAFKNSNLNGVCYNSEKQRNNLEEILTTSYDYKRATPLAFLKSSDAHNLDEIGTQKSFFKLDKLSWNSFKESFANPTEYIFTNYPKTQDIIEEIFKNEDFLPISQITDEIKKRYHKSICALNNTDGGFILFGVDVNKNVLGIDIGDDYESEIDNNIDFVFSGIKDIGYDIFFDLNVYPIQDKKAIIIVKIFKGERIVDIKNNGNIYAYNDNKIIRLPASKIQRKIENNIIDKVEKKVDNCLNEVNKQISIINTSLKSYPVMNEYYDNSILIHYVIKKYNIIKPESLDMNTQEKLKKYFEKHYNGKSKGNIYYFDNETEPRFNDACLRISIPKFYCDKCKGNYNTKKSIYIVPGGGVFYSPKQIPQFNPEGIPIIQLKCKKSSNYSAKFLTAFLKSSFLLWFFICKYNDINIFKRQLFHKIRIPKLNFKNPKVQNGIDKIEKNVNSILNKENKFVQVKINSDDYYNKVDKHNSEVDKYFHKIDNEIFKLLDLDEETKALIKKTLKANNIYVP